MRRWRLACSVVVLALTAAACNGSTSADPSPSPSPTAAAASPTPSPTPEPSPSPAEVLPANDVDDPVAALEAIVAYRDHLFENPDPDKLKLIYAERCECYDEVQEVLADFAETGQAGVFEMPREVRSAEVLERSGPSARVSYEANSPPGRLIDAEGNTLQSVEGRDFAEAEAVLVREEGRWRVVALILR